MSSYGLHPGMYFSLPHPGHLQGEQSSGIVITSLNYQGMFSLGGVIEAIGRFAYIDGGTTTLLIPPVILGDPCLHALYFPSDRHQTMHTHPSYRVGLILEGSGEAETPEGVIALQPGTVFVIPAHHRHKFRTTQNKLTFVVFHPDSDTGFTHRNHPMLNRTLIEGVSAAKLPELHTPLGWK
jgi:AraC-like ligand binding domain